MNLPKNQDAVIPYKKLTDYLLSEAHPVGKAKAQYFRTLDYRETNADLPRDGLKAIAHSNQVSETISTPFGMKYVIDGHLNTPIGIKAWVRTVCIIETREVFPRFVTAYPIDDQ
ncbi:MAG: hypothetical protein HY730_09225 [Candidatus Tectomicrobia bacterium]|uniref:DUF6883 domain-containing protein n=1 Tax=Tectimicrobiota bacterium TaxID=2528274 RepID=A0A933LRM3_UNCTE|nr:hypothetical protein [Candidatus Tectomicrobia bacterium]